MDDFEPKISQRKSSKTKSLSPNLVKIRDAARIIGVSIDTIRRWEVKGKITPVRTPGGTRLYSLKVLESFNPDAKEHLLSIYPETKPILSTPKLSRVSNQQTDIDFANDFDPSNQPIISAKSPQLPISTLSKEIYPANFFPEPLKARLDREEASLEATKSILEQESLANQLPQNLEQALVSPIMTAPVLMPQKIQTFIRQVPLYSTYSVLGLMIVVILIAFSLTTAQIVYPNSTLSSFSPLSYLPKIEAKIASLTNLFDTESKEKQAKLNAEANVLAVSSIATENKYLQLSADTDVVGNLAVEGQGIFLEDLTAPNIIYGLIAGDGIAIGPGQTPTVSSTDSLATVTSRGATTTTPVILDGGVTLGQTLKMARLASDPSSPINGSMYYNTTTNKFRCYQNGSWGDCDTDTTGGSGDITAVNTGNGLSGGADSGDITIDLDVTTTGTTTTTSANSGLETTAAGLSLLRGCSDTQILAWNAGTSLWECSSAASGATTTLQATYDNDTNGSDTIIALTANDDSLIFRNPAAAGTDSTFLLTLDQLNTGAVDTLVLNNAGTGALINASSSNSSGTKINGFLIDQSGAGTMTNAINITNSAGTLTNGITIGSGAQVITNAINIASTGVVTDIVLQNGETIDNNVDGTISMNPTILALSGTTTLTASSLATFTTAATLSMASTTTLNCGDCLNFDDFKDAMDLDANTTVQFGGSSNFSYTLNNNGTGGFVVDLTSTGDFLIRDNNTTFLSFNDDSTTDWVLPAGGDVAIDASTTASTVTTGVFDLNVNAGDAAVIASNIDLIQNTGATTGQDAVGQAINLTANDADGDVFGLKISAAATANATTGSYEAGISIDNAENTAASMTDGIIITSSGINNGVTDGLDVSAANINNGVNLGANFTLFDGIRVFEGATGTLTIEDTSGNDLVTITDGGTTGDLVSTNTLSAYGTSIGLNNDASVNNVISFGAGPGQPTGDLYWGSRLLCTAASANCGWTSSASSPFTASGGIIDKTTAADRLRLQYGDAADTQLTIDSTTNTVVPSADSVVIDLSSGATDTGIVTDGVDALSIVAEFGDGTANTNAGIHLALTPINTPSGDEVFYGVSIDGITATAASESALRIGAGWDNDLLLATDGTHTIRVQDQDSAATAGSALQVIGAAGNTTGTGGAISLTAGAGGSGAATGGGVTLTSGAGGGTSGNSGALTLNTGNTTSGTAGNIVLDVGTSTSGNGSILIGTAARAETITIGNSTGGAVRLGQNGSTVQVDGTNFDVATTGLVTLLGGLAVDLTTQGSNNLTIGPGGTGILTLDPVGAGSIVIGSVDVTHLSIITDANSDADIEIDGGTTFYDNVTLTQTGTERLSITNSTSSSTGGVASLTVSSTTNNNVGINLAYTSADGVTSGDDLFGSKMTVTQLDANGDLFGLQLINGNTTSTGTTDDLLTVSNADTDSSNGGLVDNGIRVVSSGATITDGIDLTSAGITNAINLGGNKILGTSASIDFSEFDVSGTTGSVTIDDGGNAGQLLVEGTNLDINSLDFVGAGLISVVSGNITLSGVATGTSATGLVLPIKTDTGDPTVTQTNGEIYYNSNDNKFRCYQNSAWTDCISAASTPTLQDVYNNDANGSDSIIALTANDDSLIFRNPDGTGTDSAFTLFIDQLDTDGAVSALNISQVSNNANGVNLTANNIDTETALAITANGLTTGTGLSLASSGTIATTGELLSLTADSLTSGALIRGSVAGMTTGSGIALTGPSSTGITGTANGLISLTSDVGSAGTAGQLAYLAPDFSAGSATTGYGLRLAGTDATAIGNTDYGIYSTLALTGNAAKTASAIYGTVTSTSTTADTIFGADFLADPNGAISTGTKTAYGVRAQATSDTPTDTGGTINTYGGYFAATGATGGTSTTYGVYATASGADNNYAGVFNGTVGVGETTPDTGFKLELGGNFGPNTGPVSTSFTQCTTTACRADGASSDVGQYTSMAIGADGNPIIAYYDVTNTALNVYKCANYTCSSGTAYQVDNTGDDGKYASIAIAPDGLPVISYYQDNAATTSDELKVAKCGNASCSAGNTLTTVKTRVDATHDAVGQFGSIAINTDGFPIISYVDSEDAGGTSNIFVTKCGNSTCSSGNTDTIITTELVPPQYTSMVINSDGLPFMTFYDASANDLYVVKCTNSSCSTHNTDIQVDTNDAGLYNSLAVGSDGFPIISYYDSSNSSLDFTKCNNLACSSSTNAGDPDIGNDVGSYTSIAIGKDGLPIVSYYRTTGGDLTVFKCTNIRCSTGTTTVVESTNDVGQHTSIVVPVDGLPVISFYDVTNGDLRIIKCAIADCSATSGTAVANGISGGGWMSNSRSYSAAFESINTYQISNPTTFQNLSFLTAGSEKMTIQPNGYIGIGTTTPAEKLSLAGGNLLIGAQTDATGSFAITNTSSTAGTFGAETSVDGAYSSAIYQGKLYIATKETNAMNVYRYDGANTWTKVNDSSGKIISGDNAVNDQAVLTVYNGKLYAATWNTGACAAAANCGALYEYNGSAWTLVNATRGTYSSATTIDGISDIIVYDGRLVLVTAEVNQSKVYFWNGGNTFTALSGASVGAVCGSDAADADSGIFAVWRQVLIVGLSTATTTGRICEFDSFNNQFSLINGTAGTFGGQTSVEGVTAMAVYQDNLFVGTAKTNEAGIYYTAQIHGYVNFAVFTNSTTTAGRIDSTNDATDIDSVPFLRVYNGHLYAGSNSTDLAALYEYTGLTTTTANQAWTKINATRGTFGSQTSVDRVDTLIDFDGTLYLGTEESNAGSVYTWSKTSTNSYALKFDPGYASANYGAISFVGGFNAQGNPDNTGMFNFSHSVNLTSAGFDYAEDYPTADDSLGFNEIVAVDTQNSGYVKKASNGDSIIGIVSENPGFRISQKGYLIDGARSVPIALVGRVPLKVNLEGGAVQKGDYLTSSSTPGVAMKATHPGQVVGKALEDFNSEDPTTIGKVLTFVNVSYADPNNFLASLTFDTDGTLIVPKIKTEQLLIAQRSLASANLEMNGDNIVNSGQTQDTTTSSPATNSTISYIDLTGKIGQLENRVLAAETKIANFEANQTTPNSLNTPTEATASTELATPSANLNLTPPEILLASTSASLTDINLTGNLSAEGLIKTLDLTVSGTLKALGETILGKTTIAGDLLVDATLSFTHDSINSIGTLYLQNNPLAEALDFFNGQIKIDNTGKLTATTVSASEFEGQKDQNVGSGKIFAGTSTIEILTPKVKLGSKILITPTSPTQNPIIVSGKVEGQKFTVSVSQAPTTDLSFDWLIINEASQ